LPPYDCLLPPLSVFGGPLFLSFLRFQYRCPSPSPLGVEKIALPLFRPLLEIVLRFFLSCSKRGPSGMGSQFFFLTLFPPFYLPSVFFFFSVLMRIPIFRSSLVFTTPSTRYESSDYPFFLLRLVACLPNQMSPSQIAPPAPLRSPPYIFSPFCFFFFFFLVKPYDDLIKSPLDSYSGSHTHWFREAFSFSIPTLNLPPCSRSTSIYAHLEMSLV